MMFKGQKGENIVEILNGIMLMLLLKEILFILRAFISFKYLLLQMKFLLMTLITF
jgi:hypothetical protein